MARMYVCNFCDAHSNDLDGFIEIASSNSSISVKNQTRTSNGKQLGNHSDLHFCSQECLNSFFFNELKPSSDVQTKT